MGVATFSGGKDDLSPSCHTFYSVITSILIGCDVTDFYTYVHIRNDSNTIFYVGKGCKNRAYSEQGRNKSWSEIAKEHGYTVQIVEHFDSENDAFALERYLIASFRACGVLLCNKRDGWCGDPLAEIKRKPQSERVSYPIRLTKEQIEKFRFIGGSNWLRFYLNALISGTELLDGKNDAHW